MFARYTYTLLDHHSSPLSLVLDGLLPFEAHRILHHVPNGLLAELHSQLANDLFIITRLRFILHHGHRQPFHVVLLLLSPN